MDEEVPEAPPPELPPIEPDPLVEPVPPIEPEPLAEPEVPPMDPELVEPVVPPIDPEPLVEPVPPPIDDVDEEVPADAWPLSAACCAAWVFGPMTPSIGPGSKPLSFRDCCSCFTDSSPFEEALAEPDVREDCPAEAEVSLEAEGAIEDVVPEERAVAPLDSGMEGDVWAKAVPAEIKASAAMSFLGFMSLPFNLVCREV